MKLSHSFSQRRGVALVITLIMLAVVTITAVAFLSVARRERSAVAAAGEQVDVRIAVDSALNRARMQILSQMAAATSRIAPVMFVSTNFVSPFYRLGITTAGLSPVNLVSNSAAWNNWYRALGNVSYRLEKREFDLNNSTDILNYRRMLANLFYDPRVPVVVRTSRMPNALDSSENRFYLDLNRNGRFETNGYILDRDIAGVAVGTNRLWHVGDPEWIGVLADPDRPHSGNNRFLYRIAYLVIPADRTLDLNYVHNQAGDMTAANSRFMRNQGVGSWELNLAAYFRDLNTNLWKTYSYNPNAINTGTAFDHALNVWRNRRVGTVLSRSTAQSYFANESRPRLGVIGDTGAAGRVFPSNGIDDFSNGPLLQTLAEIRYPRLLADGDQVGRAWSGADASIFYASPFQLLTDPSLLSFRGGVIWTNLDTLRGFNLAGQVVTPGQAGNSTYNAYTYYRLLASLGTDSSDGRIESGVDRAGRYYRRTKLNLNFQSLDPDSANSTSANLIVTNGAAGGAATASALIPWEATAWMNLAGDRLLRKEFVSGLVNTNQFIYRGGVPLPSVPAAHGLAVAGRGLYTNGVAPKAVFGITNYSYGAQAHRLLQLAANIHEVRTNSAGGRGTEPFPPHIYRPSFYREDTDVGAVIRLAGLEEITDARVIIDSAWNTWLDFDKLDLVSAAGRSKVSANPVSPTFGNAFGLPMVVGTKQNQTGPEALGLPTFNEAFWQTRVRVGRRLVLQRPSARAIRPITETTLSRLGFEKFGQYTIEVNNVSAVEAWNSYVKAFPSDRPLRLIATNWTEITLYDSSQLPTALLPYGRPLMLPQAFNPNLAVTALNPLVTNRTSFVVQSGRVTRIGDGNRGYKARWGGLQYIPALNTNTVFSFLYNPINDLIFPLGQTNNPLSFFRLPSARLDRLTPQLTLALTNRLIFAIVDDSFNPPRLLDFVNLKSGTLQSNLLANLMFDSNGQIPNETGDTGSAGIDAGFSNTGGKLGGGGTSGSLTMPRLWSTNVLVGRLIPSGFENQFAGSLNPTTVPTNLWTQPLVRGVRTTGDSRQDAALGLRAFLYGVNSVPRSEMDIAQRELDRMTAAMGSVNGNLIQVGFNPVGDVFLTERRMANDPFVHYTKDDLQPGGLVFTLHSGYWKLYPDVYPGGDGRPEALSGNAFELEPWRANQIAFESGNSLVSLTGVATNRTLSAYAPWRRSARLGVGAADETLSVDLAFKDPLIINSSAWSFPTPTNAFASIGQLGRIHRGTPWQTVYLKSLVANTEPSEELEHFSDRHHWKMWSGSYGTHPTNDWALLDLFSTAMNENAARGMISVNQTNLAAWSALLAGTPVLRVPRELSSKSATNLVPTIINPANGNLQSELMQIISGYQYTNSNGYEGMFHTGVSSGFTLTNPPAANPPVAGVGITDMPVPRRTLPRFESVGEICAVPTLSVGSPFLKEATQLAGFNDFRPELPDDVIERIPQQILSLLKSDEPRYVIYSWAQTLKPAAGATVTAPGPFFGLVTNYVVTGEFTTKSVLRFEGDVAPNVPVTRNLRAVVEDHRVITAD